MPWQAPKIPWSLLTFCVFMRLGLVMRSSQCYVVRGLFYLLSPPVPDGEALRFSPGSFLVVSIFALLSVWLCHCTRVDLVIISSRKTRRLAVTWPPPYCRHCFCLKHPARFQIAPAASRCPFYTEHLVGTFRMQCLCKLAFQGSLLEQQS